jgi:bacillopeptidase F
MGRVCPLSLAARLTTTMWLAAACAAPAGVLSPEVQRAMAARGTHADTAVIVRFSEPLDHQPLAVADRRQRDNRLFVALKARAAKGRAGFEPFLAAQGATRIRDLWIINGLAATLPAVAVKQLAAQPGIERIELDSFVQGGRSQRMPAARAPRVGPVPPQSAPADATGEAFVASRAKPGWNMAAVQAPELWALGHTGKGVVVATMDTGVDPMHPDLGRKWRGGANSWFDPHGEEDLPYDAVGHGTQAMGVILGGSGLGVAPDARWIAVRLYNADGRARMSDIHLAFQWLLDPDGDPATLDAPDVVNASWVLSGRGAGACIPEFAEDVHALQSAGIAVVFAAGNDGPAERTSSSPGNNPGVLSVGAVGPDLVVARQASRGPSSCDGAVFPRVVAPGADVRTSDLSHGGLPSYTIAAGSSLAAPHVAGALALLAGAFPSASVAELEDALQRSAQDLGDAGADNHYGFGLVQASAAYKALQAGTASRSGIAQPSVAGLHPDAGNALKPSAPVIK